MKVLYSVTTKDRVTLPFQCKACGHTCDILVDGEGSASVAASVVRNDVFEQDYNADIARPKAQERARQDAMKLARLARCPRCNARDDVAVRGHVRGALIALVLLAAIGAGVGAFFGRRGDPLLGAALAGGVGALIGGVFVASAFQDLKRAAAISFVVGQSS